MVGKKVKRILMVDGKVDAGYNQKKVYVNEGKDKFIFDKKIKSNFFP